MTVLEMLKEFHSSFKLAMADKPTLADSDLKKLRQDLMDEEVTELREAVEDDDIVEIADALADIVYIAYGTAVAYGIDLDAVIKEVHGTNMAKLGPDGQPIYREDGKVMKPEGWVPPNIAKVLGING